MRRNVNADPKKALDKIQNVIEFYKGFSERKKSKDSTNNQSESTESEEFE